MREPSSEWLRFIPSFSQLQLIVIVSGTSLPFRFGKALAPQKNALVVRAYEVYQTSLFQILDYIRRIQSVLLDRVVTILPSPHHVGKTTALAYQRPIKT